MTSCPAMKPMATFICFMMCWIWNVRWTFFTGHNFVQKCMGSQYRTARWTPNWWFDEITDPIWRSIQNCNFYWLRQMLFAYTHNLTLHHYYSNATNKLNETIFTCPCWSDCRWNFVKFPWSEFRLWHKIGMKWQNQIELRKDNVLTS